MSSSLNPIGEDGIFDVSWEEEPHVSTVYTVFKEKKKVKIAGMEDCDRDNKHIVLLDTCATVAVFSDKDLFMYIQETKRPLYIDGFTAGSHVYIHQEGMTPFGMAYYSTHVKGNVLSHGKLARDGYKITLNQDATEFTVTSPTAQASYKFVLHSDNHYRLARNDCGDAAVFRVSATPYTTVESNKLKYSKREIKRADAARDLQWKLGLPSTKDLIKLLLHGKLHGTETLPQDVRVAEDIYGPILGNVRGKTTTQKPHVPQQEEILVPQQVHQSLYADLMWIDKEPFFISVSKPLEYVQVSGIRAKATEELLKATRSHLAPYRHRRFQVDKIFADQESALLSNRFTDKSQVPVEECDDAVGVIERKIRTAKERARGIKATLPFKVRRKLTPWLIKYAVGRINLIPTSNSEAFLSPREKFLSRKINLHTDLKHGFADYVEVFVHSDNTMVPRTAPALALLPTGAHDGTWYYLRLDTDTTIKRRKAVPMPMPQYWIDHLNKLAEKEGEITDDIEILIGGKYIEDDTDQEPAPQDDEEEPTRWILPADDEEPGPALTSDDDLRDDIFILDDYIDPREEIESTSQTCDEVAQAVPQQQDEETVSISPQDSQESHDDSPVPVEVTPPTHGYNLRQDRKPNTRYSVFNMTIDQAIDKLGEDISMEATVKEMTSIIKTEKALQGVKVDQLNADQIKNVFPAKFFLREKFLADGTFEKVKGRYVLRGDKMKKDLFKDVYSPTVTTATVFMAAAEAHRKKKVVGTADVPTAYLRAEWPDDGSVPEAYVRMNKVMSQVCIDIDPNLKEFVNQDGTIVFKVMKALYGSPISAKLWYEKMREGLQQLGFKQNPYDRCSFKRDADEMEVHVDDYFIQCNTEEEFDLLSKELEKVFPGINIKKGPIITYLGMVFDFTDPEGVKITAPHFVDDLLRENEDIQGVSSTPAKNCLFTVNSKSPQLPHKEQKRFHSTAASLLYLAQKVRPDILLPTVFLCSRVQRPTTQDKDKLHRVIKYVRGTRDLGIKLQADADMLKAYVDASHAVHENHRSHTGAVLTLGKGPIFVKSQKQRINSRSSTESELIAVSDAITHVLWCRNWLVEQGYREGPATVFQDNKSTITLLESGASNSQRTRHVSTKYFFAHDRIKSGEIKLEYKRTEDMIADILTKPLQGSLFRRLRDLLLNWKGPRIEEDQDL